jgi:capsular polysaccharide export protein
MITLSRTAYELAAAPARVVWAWMRRSLPHSGKPPLFLFGFNSWKSFMGDWFPENEVVFTPMNMRPIEFEMKWKWRILADRRSKVLVWQYKGPSQIKSFCESRKIPFDYVEDGFVRSVSLGALHAPPMSLIFDKKDMFFNASQPTDLEDILSHFDFESDRDLMKRARESIETLIRARLSKYNSCGSLDITSFYGEKIKKRILVIGQVERDASVIYGCSKRFSNNDLVFLARHENPDAQIIYKPHPEVLAGTARAISNPDAVRDIVQVLDQDLSLPDAMDTIDHVYTITSLSGFEALLRGIKVTTVGCPFYSGWGLTDDRQPNPRRVRRLTAEQIFAAAYILYPRYMDPVTGRAINIEQSLEILSRMRTARLDGNGLD